MNEEQHLCLIIFYAPYFTEASNAMCYKGSFSSIKQQLDTFNYPQVLSLRAVPRLMRPCFPFHPPTDVDENKKQHNVTDSDSITIAFRIKRITPLARNPDPRWTRSPSTPSPSGSSPRTPSDWSRGAPSPTGKVTSFSCFCFTCKNWVLPQSHTI